MRVDEVKQRCLARVPDQPRWVETRGLLRSASSAVVEHPTHRGFVVWSDARGLGSVVGEVGPRALARAAGQVPDLLAFADNVERVRSLLPDFRAERATIYAAPDRLPPPSTHRCRELDRGEVASLEHLPADLRSELTDAADTGVPVVAAFDGPRPVAFAYAGWETEALWDVSIDTIESHRRQGYAVAAAVHLMRAMKERGKSAVWGAAESNRASANLAARLGFVEVDQLWVLTRSDP